MDGLLGFLGWRCHSPQASRKSPSGVVRQRLVSRALWLGLGKRKHLTETGGLGWHTGGQEVPLHTSEGQAYSSQDLESLLAGQRGGHVARAASALRDCGRWG